MISRMDDFGYVDMVDDQPYIMDDFGNLIPFPWNWWNKQDFYTVY